MRTFEEFVNSVDPTFFEEKGKDDGKGKKMPPWLKKDGGDKADGGDDKGAKDEKKSKKNPFMPKKDKKEC